MEYVFGKEEVELLSQIYRVFQMTNLILFALFGQQRSLRKHEKFSRLDLLESYLLLHKIAYMQVWWWIFCAQQVLKEANWFILTQVKLLLEKDDRQGIEYIKSEHGNKWTVHLSDDTTVIVNHVSLREDRTGYLYPEGRRDRNVVVQYIPIRFIIKNDGTIRYTLNRYTVKKSNGHLVPQFSA